MGAGECVLCQEQKRVCELLYIQASILMLTVEQVKQVLTEGPLLPVALLPNEFLTHTLYAQVQLNCQSSIQG